MLCFIEFSDFKNFALTYYYEVNADCTMLTAIEYLHHLCLDWFPNNRTYTIKLCLSLGKESSGNLKADW